jgi:hypothetical protein
VPRDDVVPTTADFLLTLAESHWTAVSGVLDDNLILSVRNLGYQRSAGELVQQVFSELGGAGGHRAAAKAIVPLDVVREHFGEPGSEGFEEALFRPLWEAAGAGARPAADDEEVPPATNGRPRTGNGRNGAGRNGPARGGESDAT